MLVVIIHWSVFWNLNLVYILQYLPICEWTCQEGEHHEVQWDVCGCSLLLVLLCRCMPSTQLFLNSSLEMTPWQPDKGQNVSVQDMLESAEWGWAESQPLGLFPLAGRGAPPGNGAHPQFHKELLGKSGGFICWQCAVQTCPQASPPKGRNLPLWGGEV